MSLDFQVVFPQNLVELSNVQVLPGLKPRTLDIRGRDFRSVDEVVINERPSPSVVILSTTRLLAQVPDGVLDRVTSVTVISNTFTLADKSLLRFRLGRTTQKVGGIVRLVQLFVKVLFTTQGRDIWEQRLGGNGLRNLGRNFSSQAGNSIVSDFIISVEQTARHIIATQAKDPKIPLEERLLSAKVVSVNFNRNEGALIPSIELLSQTGKTARASLGL